MHKNELSIPPCGVTRESSRRAKHGARPGRSGADRIGADQDYFEGFDVEPGSEVLAPGAALDTAGTGDFTVLLRITGNPPDVLKAYGRQFEEVCCPAERFVLEERTVNGAEQLQGDVGESGGLSVRVVTTALGRDAPVFARIDVDSD